MSQADAQRRVLQALTGESAMSPEGSAQVQEKGSSAYVAIPADLVDHFELSQGESLDRAYHPETSCLVIALDPEVAIFS